MVQFQLVTLQNSFNNAIYQFSVGIDANNLLIDQVFAQLV